MPLPDTIPPAPGVSFFARLVAALDTQVQDRASEQEARLVALMSNNGNPGFWIKRIGGQSGWQIDVLRAVIASLPRAILAAQGFRRLYQYGRPAAGAGGGSFLQQVEGSLYVPNQACVYLFPKIYPAAVLTKDDTLRTKALRTYVGIATHEFGHALLQTYLEQHDRFTLAKFRQQAAVLVRNDWLLGIDMGDVGDADARIAYQASAPDEFLAEVFMQYVLFEPELRRHAETLRDTSGLAASAWKDILSVLSSILGQR